MSGYIYTDSELIQLIVDFHNKNHQIPTSRISLGPHADTFIRRFGTWNKALQRSGLEPTRQPPNLSIEQIKIWLEKQAIKNNETGCWVWSKNKNIKGYGLVNYQRKYWYVHRLSYTLWKDIIPEGMLVQHICDNPSCFNPEHLELGTHQTNRNDSQQKGRFKINKVRPKSPYKSSDQEKFKWYQKSTQKVDLGYKTKCWIPRGGKTKEYNHQLHRWIFKTVNGFEPEIVGHKCHIKGCINPEHLYATNRRQNALDSRHYRANIHIREEQVRIVLEDFFNADFAELGSKRAFDIKWSKELNVSQSIINDIRSGNSWTDIRQEVRHEQK